MVEAWKGTTVLRHTVAVTVAEARKALAEYRNWIVYLPKRGYRLTIPVVDDQMKIGWGIAQRCTGEGLEKAWAGFASPQLTASIASLSMRSRAFTSCLAPVG